MHSGHWLPASFDAPARVALSTLPFHFRPIHPDDTALDMIAVMGSRERLWSIYGKAWGWPPEAMSAEADRDDLARHADEMTRNESFNYALFDSNEAALLGCLYIDPPERVGGADAEISWWVIDELVDSPIARLLETFVPEWIAQNWPFQTPRYVGRDLTWDDWLALEELPPVEMNEP